MSALDADNGSLSTGGRTAERDIVQVSNIRYLYCPRTTPL